MRIISGTARGTNLYTLEGVETRPTLDRVKESLFNIINNKIYNAVVLDLFAGSGAIGLEFASRGAKKVILCDNSYKAVRVIQKNIEKTHMMDKVALNECSYEICLNNLKNTKLDIIYLDPPYKTNYIKTAIDKILKLNIINKDGIIITETDEPDRIINEIKDFNIDIIDKRKYGRAYLIFLKVKET